MPTTPTLGLPYPTQDDTVDVPRDVQALAQAIDPLGVVPVGAFMMWLTAIAPMNWLFMNGQQVDAAAYPRLAQLLGQTAGKVTIPDMRDFFPAGAGTVALGQTAGAASVALTAGQSGLPSHNHGGATAGRDRSQSHAHGLAYPGMTSVGILQNYGNGSYMGIVNQAGGAGWWSGDTVTVAYGDAPDHLHGVYTEAARNATDAHENRPPLRAVNFIMRAG